MFKISFKKILLILFLVSLSNFSFAKENQINKNLLKHERELALYDKIWKIREVKNKKTTVARELNHLNNIDFALSPLNKPITPMGEILLHNIGPVTIILPRDYIITNASLSNTKLPPMYSQNIVEVMVDKSFLSGILNIDYIKKENLNKVYRITLKADYYIKEDVASDKLFYSQIKYFEPKTLEKHEVLALLEKDDYSKKHNEVVFQNKRYYIDLISIKDFDGKTLVRHKSEKYTNFSLLNNSKNYNFHIYNGKLSN